MAFDVIVGLTENHENQDIKVISWFTQFSVNPKMTSITIQNRNCCTRSHEYEYDTKWSKSFE